MPIKVQFALAASQALGGDLLGAYDLDAIPGIGDAVQLLGKKWRIADVEWRPAGQPPHVLVTVHPT